MKLIRRLKEIVDNKIPEYVYKHYPYLIEFIYGYVDFIDQEVGEDCLNFTENLNPDKILDRFLDDYFQQYCSQLINTELYQITDANKRLFLSIAKFFYKNKGKKFSFDIVLKYLTQFFVFKDENYIDVIDYEIIEDINGWYSSQIGESYSKPYTYIIKGDFPKSLIVTMIENLNPVGFYPEFQFSQIGEETYFNQVLEEYDINTNHIPKFEETYDSELKVSETFSISVNANLSDESNLEFYKTNSNSFKYNGKFKYNGLKKYNGVDNGTWERFDIQIFRNGVLIEDIASTLNPDA